MVWLKRSPEEKRLINLAQVKARQALKKGLIKRGPCAKCGKRPEAQPPGKVSRAFHMHHDDYLLPYQITWLCSRCHWHLHKDTPYEGDEKPDPSWWSKRKLTPQGKIDTFDEQYRMLVHGCKEKDLK